MGFSPLATGERIPDGGRSNPRNSRITGFTIHHQAGVDAHGEASNPNREVSANYWITNDGTIIPNIDETRRAWTTGHANYPAGRESDHRNITVEVSNSPEGVRNGTWAISSAAYNSLVALIGDVFKRHELGSVRRGTHGGVAVHQDFVATACPGPYIMSHLGSIIAAAEKARTGGESTPAPKPPAGDSTASKSIATLAQEVLAGKHGNGDVRKRSLGSKYAAVQAEVNRLLSITPGKKVSDATRIDRLAQAVLRGDYGNGEQRRLALGGDYAAVQLRVNQILAGSKPKAAAPARKSNQQIANEIVFGVNGTNPWGDNPARRQRLTAAGYNASAIQALVNKMV